MMFSTQAEAKHQKRHSTHKHQRSSSNDPNVKARIVLIFDEENQNSLFDKNSEKIVPIASITKLMTAMVTLDAALPLDEVLTVGSEDLKSTIHSRIKIGTKLTRAELLQLALMSSENRAALTLAKSYPGGLEAFIVAMNDKAEELEMTNTKFFDPTGLDQNNVSTARDLVKMVTAASTYQEIHEYTTTSSHDIDKPGSKKPLQFHNTNPLVSMSEWNIGVSKTGYIRAAGRCLVMRTVINDRKMVIVILNAKTKYIRVNDAKAIKKWVEKKTIIDLSNSTKLNRPNSYLFYDDCSHLTPEIASWFDLEKRFQSGYAPTLRGCLPYPLPEFNVQNEEDEIL